MTTALKGVRILDASGPIGWYAARILADLGADVIRVEPPDDPNRSLNPQVNGVSMPHWWYNAGKRRTIIDLETAEGQQRFRDLAHDADVVIETFEPGTTRIWGIDVDRLRSRNRGLIYTSVTPFGQTGPRANWRGTDISGLALGGLLHLSGNPSSPPSQAGGDLGYLQTGIVAAAATMIALVSRDRTGLGQHIDVSLQDTMIFTLENALGLWDLMGLPRPRIGGKAFAGGQVFYPAKDGWQAVWMGQRWEAFLGLAEQTGIPIDKWLDEKWTDQKYRAAHIKEIVDATVEMTATMTRSEFTEAAQSRRVASAAVNHPSDLFHDLQLAARDFWLDVEIPAPDGSLVQARFPGAPFKMSKTQWQVSTSLNEPDDSADWLDREPPLPPSTPGSADLPLAGLRVLDFTWQIAGPGACQVLADHGADVLKIETATHPDGLRVMAVPRPPWTTSLNQSGIFSVVNTSKRSVSINLSTDEGREILKELISLSDVIVDNYGVDPFPKWGLTPAQIREINPDIIIARSSVMGRSGPLTRFIGFGFTIGPAAGLNAMTGFPGDPPVGTCTAHPDYSCNPYHLLIAILSAVHYRNRTGEGQEIDLSQHESTVVFNGAFLPWASLTGEDVAPNRNRHPNMAPHGVYPAIGPDRWVTIVCEGDDEWQVLAATIGRSDLAARADLATREGRAVAQDELDEAISAWTRRHTADEAMMELQGVGIAAARVSTVPELFADDQLAARGKLERVPHPELGTTVLNTPSFQLSGQPGGIQRHPPLIGQDTEDVMRELLGKDDEQMVDAYVLGLLE